MAESTREVAAPMDVEPPAANTEDDDYDIEQDLEDLLDGRLVEDEEEQDSGAAAPSASDTPDTLSTPQARRSQDLEALLAEGFDSQARRSQDMEAPNSQARRSQDLEDLLAEGFDSQAGQSQEQSLPQAATAATGAAVATATIPEPSRLDTQPSLAEPPAEAGEDGGELPSEDELFGPEPEETRTAADAAAASAMPPPPPPPYSASTQAAAEDTPSESAADFVDESRFTKDQNGVLMHKWKADYAPRGGGGRAQCRDPQCLEMAEQAGVKIIEKGVLRIARRVLMQDGEEEKIMMMWYHARCMFATFKRSRKTTRCIESPEDIEGFESVESQDQELLRRWMKKEQDPMKGRTPQAGGHYTPEKRSATGEPESREAKKVKKLLSEMKLAKGDRVWTHCRVRPSVTAAGPGGFVDVAVKSAKPELCEIREEAKDGQIAVQFESAEHEKERLKLFANPKRKKTRGWNRFPRFFEGKKQRVPLSWIVQNRTPPRLCSCIKQDWGHQCGSGDIEDGIISCGRGTMSKKVYGVMQ